MPDCVACASKAFGYQQKHENHLALLERMFKKDRLDARLLHAPTLEAVYLILLAYPLIGRFMAYQLAIDLNYSPYPNFSENSFTVAGPGAIRGIKKCFLSTGGNDTAYLIHWMVEHAEQEFERLGITFQDLWGRPLHSIDCQGLFCETDKYARVAFPELKSNRKRVKTKFQPKKEQIPYFYPPKWKL